MKSLLISFLGFYLLYIQVGAEIGENEAEASAGASESYLPPASSVTKPGRLLPLTVVDRETDGLRRLLRSSDVYELQLKVLGKGDLKPKPGFKKLWSDWDDELLLLRREVAKHRHIKDLVILVVDGHNTIFGADEEVVLQTFRHFRANIVFGGSGACVPEEFREASPPYVEKFKYLNAGIYAGYAPYLHKLLSYPKIEGDDFQTHFQRLYTDPKIREELQIEVDPTADMIVNIDNEEDNEFVFNLREDDTELRYDSYHTDPPVLHAISDAGRSLLANFGNYIAKSRSFFKCLWCEEGRINLADKEVSAYPKVLLGLFVEEATPKLARMLKKVSSLSYPKERIVLHVYNMIPKHKKALTDWLDWVKSDYASVKYVRRTDATFTSKGEAKKLAVSDCLAESCDVFFNVESDVIFDNPDTLSLLVSYNKTILAPVMTRSSMPAWATFWGQVEGHYYKRSFNYIDIIEGNLKGIWNVPFVYGVYVVWRSAMEDRLAPLNYLTNGRHPIEPMMAFTINNRANHVFMYVVNLEEYGHLAELNEVEDEEVEAFGPEGEKELNGDQGMRTEEKEELTEEGEELTEEGEELSEEGEELTEEGKELIEEGDELTEEKDDLNEEEEVFVEVDEEPVEKNEEEDKVLPVTLKIKEWEKKYLHPDYFKVLQDYGNEFDTTICDDVFTFPVFSEIFCQYMINLTSDFHENKARNTTEDKISKSLSAKMGVKRLVQMSEVEYEAQWRSLVKTYILPLLPLVSIKSHSSAHVTAAFVAKFEPNSEPYFLNFEPSVFTVRVMLNRVGRDYKGSDWKFSGKNCGRVPEEVGRVVIYPGRFKTTEAALHVRDGDKYEIITFINNSFDE